MSGAEKEAYNKGYTDGMNANMAGFCHTAKTDAAIYDWMRKQKACP